jgi:hypothetical protein
MRTTSAEFVQRRITPGDLGTNSFEVVRSSRAHFEQ